MAFDQNVSSSRRCSTSPTGQPPEAAEARSIYILLLRSDDYPSSTGAFQLEHWKIRLILYVALELRENRMEFK
jgi:hypothetical protein